VTAVVTDDDGELVARAGLIVEDIDLSELLPERPVYQDVRPYDRVRAEGRVRATLGFALLVLLAIPQFIAFALLLRTDDASAADVAQVLSIIYTPLIGLAGSALGFYFGTREKNDEPVG
jgi:hypothetical protein